MTIGIGPSGALLHTIGIGIEIGLGIGIGQWKHTIIQNNIDPNFSEGLNEFTCEQSLSHVAFVLPFKSTSVFAGSGCYLH